MDNNYLRPRFRWSAKILASDPVGSGLCRWHHHRLGLFGLVYDPVLSTLADLSGGSHTNRPTGSGIIT
jgi:hypothetical protein